MSQHELNKLRKILERIDDEVVALLDERMAVAEEIGAVKDALALPLSDSRQEKAILRRLQKNAHHPLVEDFVEPIFGVIFDCAKAARALRQSVDLSIGVLGLGLIGGSILRALKAGGRAVATLARDDADFVLAKKTGFVDRVFSSLEDLVSHVDCLVLAVPIGEVLPLAHEIAKLTQRRKKPLLVLDVASVKGEIAKGFETLTDKCVEFVATHPMAGREKCGFGSSLVSLFVNAPWVITPHARNSAKSLRTVEALVQCLGARPVTLSPSTHDHYAAVLSHVPGILAKSYLEFAWQNLPDVEDFAGPGFRSFTRVGYSNSRMRREIAKVNHQEIDAVLSKWLATIRRPHE